MSASDPPTLGTGKICYIEIPATDIDRSAQFYSQAFGWQIRRRGDGEIAFDDTVNEVSGAWVLGRPPSPQPGLMVYIMVANASEAVKDVLAAGGHIVQPLDPAAHETIATFSDPGGNVLGIYQQPGLADTEIGGPREQPLSPTVAPVPAHLHTVTPRLVVSSGSEAIEFYRRAFGAQEIGERFAGPDGEIIHAELRIGDSIVMITEGADSAARAGSPAPNEGAVSAIMATYWENVDDAWERAVGAGAEVLYPLADHFYGERGGRLRDPYGQQWMLSQHIEDVSSEEMARRAAQTFGSDG